MKYEIKSKSRKIHTLDNFVSVPKVFLALPFFNTKRAVQETYDTIKIPKFQNMTDICLNSLNMSIFNDFDYFLYIYKKMIKARSRSIEFDNNEMFRELGVKTEHRSMYYKDYCNSIFKLKTINFNFTKDKAQIGFVFFSDSNITRQKTKLVFSEGFVNFFNDLRELYEIDFDILRDLKNEYQRILYILYVCNRMNKINVFSMDFLKERFQLDSLKMPEKTFAFKIRKANKELVDMKLIDGFKEVKESDKKNAKTISYRVEYSYAKLYRRKKDLSGFKDGKPFDVKPEKEEEKEDQPTVEDEEFFDDSYLKN